MAGTTFVGNLRSAPIWAKDFAMGREHLQPFGIRLDPTTFTNYAGTPVTLTAPAAAGATSLTVTAINFGSTFAAATSLIAQNDVVVPSGTTVTFGSGGTKFALTTADAHYGDTTLTVAPIPTALVVGDTGTYVRYGGKFVPSGVLVGRTAAQQLAGTPFHPAITGGGTPDTEVYLVAFDVLDVTVDASATAYRPTSRVAINYLPNYSSFAATDTAAIQSLYQCFMGVD